MNKKLNRRSFLQTSATAAVAAGFFSTTGMRAALAAAKLAGKQVLTERNLNTFIASMMRTRDGFRKWVDEVKGGLRGHLTTHFEMTKTQLTEFDGAFTSEIIVQVNEGLERAYNEKKPVKVMIVPATRRAAHAPMPLPKIDIHFGDDGFSIKVSK